MYSMTGQHPSRLMHSRSPADAKSTRSSMGTSRPSGASRTPARANLASASTLYSGVASALMLLMILDSSVVS